jgi:anti-anti-sigma factor
MNVTSTQEGNITIAHLEGHIDSSVAGEFEASMNSFLDQGVLNLVLTFTALDYISSAGLRVLLMTAKRLKALNGKFVLCEIKPNIKEVLEVSGFASVLTIKATLGDAVLAAS